MYVHTHVNTLDRVDFTYDVYTNVLQTFICPRAARATHPVRLGVLPVGRVHVVQERGVVLVDGGDADLHEGVDHVGVARNDRLQVRLRRLLPGGGGEQAAGEGRPRILQQRTAGVSI